MRFLANENFPFPSIRLLRESNFYVSSICEDRPGITDSEVIQIAIKEQLIILTFDKDYGELIFRSGVINPPAVVFFRYKGLSPSEAGVLLLQIIAEKSIELDGVFTVVEKNNVRQRKY